MLFHRVYNDGSFRIIKKWSTENEKTAYILDDRNDAMLYLCRKYTCT